MKAVVQRVLSSQVEVDGNIVGSIGPGLNVLLGIASSDTIEDTLYLVEKICNLRIFSDYEGKMNRSLLDVNGSLLVISQFTLYGDCAKGRRPSFVNAAPPEVAKVLYENFLQCAKRLGVEVQSGIFQADMRVTILNDGPVTLIVESKKSN